LNLILGFGVILLLGLAATRVTYKIKIPAITDYLLLGIIIGPSVLHIIPENVIGISGIISNVVLGLIAFTIGQNFSKANFERIGRQVLWISILETLGAWLFVTLTFILLLRMPLYLAILFGAISSATAPTATLMVIREYHSKGIFTDTLLGVVAIDDAWCLIVFAVSLAISKAIYVPTNNPHLLRVVFGALIHIFGAFLLGGVIAFLLYRLSGFLRNQAEILTYTIGFLFLNTGLAIYFNLSVLLANMFLGAVLVNINQANFKFFDTVKTVDFPLFLVFFVIAGVNLEISLLGKLGIIGSSYVIVRITGKVIGARIGGYISGAEGKIKKYLGWGLVPQAGVALGTALAAKAEFPKVGGTILTTIVATTVIYEIFGPLCTKYALKKAGEIGG